MHVQHGQDQARLPTPPLGESLQPTEAGASAPARNAPEQYVFDSRLDIVLSDFEAACQSDSPPTLEDYWAQATRAGIADSVDQRRALLQEMIALDLEYRWKRKTTALPDDQTLLHGGAAEAIPRLEDYQSLLESQFGPMPAWPVSLILDECRIQRQYAEVPSPSAYQQRFPEVPGLPEALRQMIENPTAGLPPMPAVSDNRPLADYVLVREIARGGMGVVYEARQKSLRRTVAIKMILAGQLASDEAVRRFYAEAQAAAGLSHPHIVPVFEVGQDAGRHFFSMGYVDGKSLSAHVSRDGPLRPETAARMVETISQAVDYAHQQGVVHRDLKPQNVLLTKDGRPLVSDFGLAKQMGELDGLTVSGQLVGTPSFMSPEQAQGRIEEVGPLSDVYALGAVLYHLLTGRPPFHTASMLETLKQVIERDPVSPRSMNPEVNQDLETICLKCLQKDASKRYASAQQLADDLRRFQEGRDILARPISSAEKAWRWCRRRPSAAALITMTALVLLVGVPGILWYQGQLTATQALARAADAERTAAEERAKASQQLFDVEKYHNKVNEAEQTITRGKPGWSRKAMAHIEHAAELNTPARKPVELRTEAAKCLLGIDVMPGPELAENIHAGQVAFSHDGKWLAVGEARVQAMIDCRILVIDVATGEAVHKLSLFGLPLWIRGGFRPDGCRQLVFSPDGRWLVAGARSGNVHAWDLRQTPPKIQTWRAHGNELAPLLFAPDSRRLYTACPAEKTVKAWALQGDRFEAAAQHVTEGAIGDFSLNPGGEYLVVDEDPHFVTLLDDDTLGPVHRAAHGRSGSVVAASWNGSYLAGSGHKLELLDFLFTVQSTYEDPADSSRELGELTAAQFSDDGGLLLVVTKADRRCTLWDTVSRKAVFNTIFEPEAREIAAITADGRRLAIAGDRGVQLHEIMVNRGQSLVMDRAEAPQAMNWGPTLKARKRHYDRWGGQARQIALTPEGKLLVAGSSPGISFGTVLRYRANGSFDNGWDRDGIMSLNNVGGHFRIDEARLLDDGSTLAVGPAPGPDRSSYRDDVAVNLGIARCSPSGGYDRSLAARGHMLLPLDATTAGGNPALAAGICADGRVVAAAITQREGREELVLARVLPDGRLDKTFGEAGHARHKLREQPGHRLHDLLVLPDDQIAVALEFGGPPKSWSHLGLFSPQGEPRFDPYDSTDWYPAAVSTLVETTSALALAPDASVILTLAYRDDLGSAIRIVRRAPQNYLAGAADTFLLRPAIEQVRIHRAAVQDDSKLVLAGAGLSNGRWHALVGRVELGSQQFDPTFDGDGWRLCPVEGAQSEAFGLALGNESEVLLAGAENHNQFQRLWRLSAEGKLLQETEQVPPAFIVQRGGSPDSPLLRTFIDQGLLSVHHATGRVALGRDRGNNTWLLEVWKHGESSWKLLVDELFTDLKQVGFSHDGNHLWGISEAQKIWTWELSTDKLSERFENWFESMVTGRGNLTCLTVGSDFLLVGRRAGDMLRLGMQEGPPERWNLETGPVRCVALSTNERLAVCGAEDGQVRLLRLPGGESPAGLRSHDESVEAVSFSPDGQLLATGSLDRTVRLWQLRDGGAEELLDLKFPAPVLDVQFRPDGRVLAVRVRNEIAIRLLHVDQLREFLAGLKLDWTN